MVRISDDPHRFDPGARLLHADGRELVVEDARVHRDRFLVKFEGVSTRTEAESLRGALFVPGSEARDLNSGEFWEHDLVEAEVVDVNGDTLGRIVAVVPGPAQDLFEVATPSGTVLVPFVSEIVREVDAGSRRVVVDPPAGLFDAS